MGLKPALFWFTLFAALALMWKLLDLPSDEVMIMLVKEWLIEYGLLIVFIGSLIETVLFVGFYFPGSLIIFLSVALSPDPRHAALSILTVSAGMLCGYSINYVLGKYGWYRLFLKLGMKQGLENAQRKMTKNDVRYIFYTYWNPALAAFSSTAAGTLLMDYRRFLILMVVAIAIWNTFWGVVAYSLGEAVLVLMDISLILKIVAVWILFEVALVLWKKYKARTLQAQS